MTDLVVLTIFFADPEDVDDTVSSTPDSAKEEPKQEYTTVQVIKGNVLQPTLDFTPCTATMVRVKTKEPVLTGDQVVATVAHTYYGRDKFAVTQSIIVNRDGRVITMVPVSDTGKVIGVVASDVVEGHDALTRPPGRWVTTSAEVDYFVVS